MNPVKFTIWTHDIERAVWWARSITEEEARALWTQGVTGICCNGKPWRP